MEHDITILKMKARTIGSICLVIALIISCTLKAKAEIIDPQHITTPSTPPAYAEHITTPYIESSTSSKNYWGLFFENLGAESPKSYTIASSIEYDELSLDRDNIALYGIQNNFSAMSLYVNKYIDINASGADNVTTSGVVRLVGIDSLGNITTSSDASISIISEGAGAQGAGDITIPDVWAVATGVQTTGNGTVLTINGDVTVEAHGGCTQAEATGHTMASANGILHSGATGEIENNGTLKVIARSGAISNQSAGVMASGIQSSGTTRITNTGKITVEGWAGETTSSNLSYAKAGVSTYGIKGAGEVINSGEISVNAQSGTGMQSGINAFGIYGADVTNDGTVIVESVGGVSSSYNSSGSTYGLYSKGNLDNSGDVTVTSKGGTLLKSGVAVPLTVSATGIRSGTGSVKNTGDIYVRVEGASCNTETSATSNYALGYGLDTKASTISNTGNIDLHVVGGAYDTDNGGVPTPVYAYGIVVRNDATLHSSGLIHVTAEMNPSITASLAPEERNLHTYQVITVGNLRITGYAMELGHEQAEFNRMYQGVIGSVDEATVTFDNTKLFVHLTDDYKNGLYDIPRLWKQETAEQKAANPNQFASLESVHVPPGVKIELFPGNVSTPQRIGLNYEPEVSTPLKQALISMKLESHIHAIIQNNLAGRMMFRVLPDANPQQSDTPEANPQQSDTLDGYGVSSASSTMVASLSNPNILPVMTAKQTNRHSLFMRPVYVNSNDSASSGYNSNTYGFVLGYNYNMNEELNDCYVGFHAGYTRGDTRYTGEDYGKRKDFVDTYYGGVHGIKRFNSNVLLSGEASFFYVDSEMTDDNPTNRETARYDSVSIRAEADLGYLWTVSGHNIIPEVGLQYVWQHRDPFTTDNKDSADITYGTMDNHELYGNARVKWTKQFVAVENWRITPLVGVGITQVLTDGEISNTMRLGNETQLVVDQDENTTFTPEANITVAKDNYYAAAGYTGGFGGTTKNNLFWLQLGVNF
ncbi:autotransporter domain-containing protein [Halodesulfovibrio aestuarii]|uniref:autotransporter domain-containing protein n=1 Tax=Halodesulfovibrio aestuarii TaxID=126333 RepID=UPI003D3526DD